MKIVKVGSLLIILVFSMTFFGCNTDEPPTYYYEAYIITAVQHNSFASTIPSGLNYTFNQIQGFRNTLRNFNGTFIASEGKVSEDDLRTFANQHGIGGTEYTQAKNSLDEVGNIILFFTYAPSPTTHVVWMYVEKE